MLPTDIIHSIDKILSNHVCPVYTPSDALTDTKNLIVAIYNEKETTIKNTNLAFYNEQQANSILDISSSEFQNYIQQSDITIHSYTKSGKQRLHGPQLRRHILGILSIMAMYLYGSVKRCMQVQM